MQDLMVKKELTMSSLDIAKLTGKNHSDVKRGIMNTLAQADLDPSKFAHVYSDENNRNYPCYLLPKRECDLVVSGYSVKYRLAIIDRWQELENKQPNVAVIPNFSNPVEAARAWADAKESEQKANEQLAISAPKAAAFDLISNAEGELCLTDAAKHLQVPPRKFNKFLQIQGWIFKRSGSGSWSAYQNRINSGHMAHRRVTFERSSGDIDTTWQPLITPKGIQFLSLYPAIQEMKLS